MSLEKHGVQFRKIDSNEVTELFYVCWAFAKKNYAATLLFAVLSILLPVFVALGFLKYPLANTALRCFSMGIAGAIAIVTTYGTFQLFRKWEAGQKVGLDTFLSFFSKDTDSKRYQMLLVAWFVYSAAIAFITSPGEQSSFLPLGTMFTTVMGMVVGALLQMALPLMIFKNLELKEAAETAIAVLKANLGPLMLMYMGMSAIGVVCVLACGLPYLFIAMPLLYGIHYFFYRATCEGLVLDRKNYEAQSQPATQDPGH